MVNCIKLNETHRLAEKLHVTIFRYQIRSNMILNKNIARPFNLVVRYGLLDMICRPQSHGVL